MVVREVALKRVPASCACSQITYRSASIDYLDFPNRVRYGLW